MNRIDKQILHIALPSIVSNITVPLLGLVDVTIVGHLGSAAYIGAIAVGGMLFNIIYWIFGFLRMGYSFLDIKSNFDEKTKGFMIPKIDARNLVFPNEGMHTRTLNLGMTKDGKFERLYVETSTPGLKGQSGGPIFDREGHLYAMQVNTAHLPLGFHPTAQYDGNAVVENQFLNVGNGVHMKTIRAVLDDRGVRYDAEGDESGFRIID